VKGRRPRARARKRWDWQRDAMMIAIGFAVGAIAGLLAVYAALGTR
jgi:hypothetical protein